MRKRTASTMSGAARLTRPSPRTRAPIGMSAHVNRGSITVSLLYATTTFTVQLPLPTVGELSVIQPTSVVAVHVHPLIVVTTMLPDPGELLIACAAGARTNLHAAGSEFGTMTGDVGLELGPATDDGPPQPGATTAKTSADTPAAT
jgi:hypothetical protein